MGRIIRINKGIFHYSPLQRFLKLCLLQQNRGVFEDVVIKFLKRMGCVPFRVNKKANRVSVSFYDPSLEKN